MRTIAIIGAGFTGTMIATHLLRQSRGATRVALIERTGRFGRGAAYGTTCGEHVLNVPAGRMSAFENDPDHFLRWAKAQDDSVVGGSFVPRMMYGRYLGWLLDEVERGVASDRMLERITGRATAIRAEAAGPLLILDNGTRLRADRIVLAVGNFPPADPMVSAEALASPAYVREPWTGDRLNSIGPDEDVLLIGTGLTMIDVALELRARGHRGRLTAVSRRGLLSQPHRSPAVPYHPEPPADLDSWPKTALGLLKAVRVAVGVGAARGIDWREIVTSLRADTPRLWASMSEREQRRFLERVRPFWETHRHRAAPQAAAAIEALIGSGRLKIHAARLVSLEPSGTQLKAAMRLRGADGLTTITVSRAVNCTGPDTDLARCTDPLICALREQGFIRPDSLGLGLLTTNEGVALGRSGPVPWLAIAGPLRRAQLWENTAVPELRIEAAALASRLAHEPTGAQ